jgi:hypothetical protein
MATRFRPATEKSFAIAGVVVDTRSSATTLPSRSIPHHLLKRSPRSRPIVVIRCQTELEIRVIFTSALLLDFVMANLLFCALSALIVAAHYCVTA